MHRLEFWRITSHGVWKLDSFSHAHYVLRRVDSLKMNLGHKMNLATKWILPQNILFFMNLRGDALNLFSVVLEGWTLPKLYLEGENPLQWQLQRLQLSDQPIMSSPSRIAFGSCNSQDLQNNLWPIIEERKPAGFIWGGDSIYAGEYQHYVRVFSY